MLVIIGLLVGGGIAALSAGTEQARRSRQSEQLRSVQEALYGFAMAEGRLPCADSDHPLDGAENFAGGACEAGANSGALPWATLGLGRRDAWGSPLRYRVDKDYADDPPTSGGSSFALEDGAALEIREHVSGTLLAGDVPAVVVSYGPQGDQVWTASGFTCPGAVGFSADEIDNCDNDGDFVAARYREPQADDGRFDDIVTWLAGPVLKARMVQAGRLP